MPGSPEFPKGGEQRQWKLRGESWGPAGRVTPAPREGTETGEGKRSLKEGHWSRFQIQRKTRKKYKGI